MFKKKLVYLSLSVFSVAPHVSAAWSEDAAQLLNDWLQNKAGKSRAANAPLPQDTWAPQIRHIDERLIDERNQSVMPVVHAEQPKVKPITSKVRSAVAKSSIRSASADVHTACVNVARTWDGLAQLARVGQEQRAYDGYLRLLSVCSRDSELEGTAHQAKLNLAENNLRKLLDEPVMSASVLAGARYQLASHLFYLDNKQGKSLAALASGRGLKDAAVARKDADLLQVLGWLEHNARNGKEAERLFRQAVRFDPENEVARVGLATVLLARERPEAALAVVENVESEAGDRIKARALSAQAQDALANKQFEKAALLAKDALSLDDAVDDALLVQGWVALRQGEVDKAAKAFNRVYAQNAENAGATLGLVAVAKERNDLVALQRWAKTPGMEGESARRTLEDLYQVQGRRQNAAEIVGEKPESGSAMYLGGGFRSKSGDSGEERLQLIMAPHLGAQVDSGNGVLNVSAEHLYVSNGARSRNGEAGHMAYIRAGESSMLSGALDFTKLGQAHVGGGVEYKRWDGFDYWSLGASRQLVMDSLRSMGADKSSGVGPISKMGLRLATSFNISKGAAWETETKLGAYSGSGVTTNAFFEHENALLLDVSAASHYLAVGPLLRVAASGRDENRFELGYGGYFSPESEFGAGIKLRSATPAGRKWLVKGEGKGMYTTRSLYDGTSNTMALEGSVGAGILLNSHLIGWGKLGTRFSSGYSDVSAYLGVSIPFQRRGKLSEIDIPDLKIE